MNPAGEPLLSFVLCGRRDDYLGDFGYRLSTSIGYLCRSARLIGHLQDIEIVVVDWNGTEPLSQAIDLDPESSTAVRFIVVPPEVAATRLAGERPFNVPVAFNTGIRRARGRFIVIMSADILFPRTALLNLMRFAAGECSSAVDPSRSLLNIERKIIAPGICERRYTLEQWDRFLELQRHQGDYKRNLIAGTAGGVGAIMLPAALWKAAEGFNETFGGAYGWFDIELSLRINQRYPGLDSSNIGIITYDIAPPGTVGQGAGRNPGVVASTFSNGNPEWGLGELSLAEETPVGRELLPSDESEGSAPSRRTIFENLTGRGSRYDPWRLLTQRGTHCFRSLLLALMQARGNEWACYRALAGIVNLRPPANYLEYGISAMYTGLLAVGSNPDLQIYGIDDWLSNRYRVDWVESREDRRHSDFRLFVQLLRRSSFPGMIRFVTGEPATALNRLLATAGADLAFELILFRTELFPEATGEILAEVLAGLTGEGTLILTGKDRRHFDDCLDIIGEILPAHTVFVCRHFTTAVAVRTGADHTIDTRREERHLKRAWRKPLFMTFAGHMLPALISLRRLSGRRGAKRKGIG